MWWAVASLIAVAAAGYTGFQLGADSEVATQARENKASEHAAKVAAETAAKAIAAIEVKNVVIHQRTERTTREVPVYRDCRHDPSVLRDINDARTGSDSAAAQLPATSAPGR